MWTVLLNFFAKNIQNILSPKEPAMTEICNVLLIFRYNLFQESSQITRSKLLNLGFILDGIQTACEINASTA